MIKDVNKIITEARPLYLELERILNLCKKFEKQTGLKIDEMLTFDLKKMSENSIFDENQEKALLRVCLAGNFSSGKSSFLNELLEDELLPVALSRTTRGITRIHYSTNKTFKKDHKNISYEEYCEEVKKGGNFEISMPAPFLKNLVISDVPGFDPPQKKGKDEENSLQDEEISRKEMDNADVLIWLNQLSDGTDQQSGIQFLEKYQKAQKDADKKIPPLYLVITKCDSIESKQPEKRERVKKTLLAQLKKIGFIPESTFFFSRKCKLPKLASFDEHRNFILDEQKKLKDTIAQMADKHHSVATQRIRSKITDLEKMFMQSLYEFSKQIQMYHNKWKREFLENNNELKNYLFAIGRNKGEVCEAFCRDTDILLQQVSHALEKVKFCYLYKNPGTFFDFCSNYYININNWKEEWSKQRQFINNHIETIPNIYRKYFVLPQTVIHEEHIPQKKEGLKTYIFGIKIEETFNNDTFGNSDDQSSLQRKVDNYNREIRNTWKEKISIHLAKRKSDFYKVVDEVFKIKTQETEKFEIAFSEFSALDNLVK